MLRNLGHLNTFFNFILDKLFALAGKHKTEEMKEARKGRQAEKLSVYAPCSNVRQRSFLC